MARQDYGCLSIVMLVLTLLVGGCAIDAKTKTAMGKVPKLDIPPRPTLMKILPEDIVPMTPEARAKVVSNNDALQLYAQTLEMELKAYNLYAERWNSMADTWLNANVQTTKAK